MSIAQANIEGFIDHCVEPTEQRFRNILSSLQTIASLLDDCGLEKPPKAIVLRSSVFNASDLFAAQVSSAGGVAKARDITVIYQPTESDMPGAFCGDSLRITQIVQNLVLNAIHHAPRGGHVDVHAKCS
ncbi:MAG: sensor histidine kinase, partial [Candidatus Tyrphobacter sp.]